MSQNSAQEVFAVDKNSVYLDVDAKIWGQFNSLMGKKITHSSLLPHPSPWVKIHRSLIGRVLTSAE